MARQFAAEVDFFSVGTNDLTQYTLAMDRGHPKLAPQVDALNPAVLGLIADCRARRARRRPLGRGVRRRRLRHPGRSPAGRHRRGRTAVSACRPSRR